MRQNNTLKAFSKWHNVSSHVSMLPPYLELGSSHSAVTFAAMSFVSAFRTGLLAPFELGQVGSISTLSSESSSRSRTLKAVAVLAPNGQSNHRVTCPVILTHNRSLGTGIEQPYKIDEHLVKALTARNWFLSNSYSRIDCVSISGSPLSPANEAEGQYMTNSVPPKDCQRANGHTSQSLAEGSDYKYELQKGLEQSSGFRDEARRLSGDHKTSPSFFVVRDDLLHPLMGGNKLRKLDALIPQLQHEGVSDVVTCGGTQSAHTAAVAVACAETGLNSHLLLRGERPQVLTGYTLICHMYGHVAYIPRSEYADRDAMFEKHVARLSKAGARKVGVIKEGAGDALALLGLIRLVDYLRSVPAFRGPDLVDIVVDSGTGTTAVGIALGVALLGLPWTVSGVMLASGREYYMCQQGRLVEEFWAGHVANGTAPPDLRLEWIDRETPRKFGKVFTQEFATCKDIARQTGVLLDPIYTLAGWEVAARKARELCAESKRGTPRKPRKVIFLHTGGTLGLFGLAQRHPSAI